MPFTFSHPAIVIPIKEKWKKYFSLTGLVLGSMSPDFEYFIRLAPIGKIGHTFKGFLYFNLPLCTVIAFLFHYIIKEQFILNSPQFISNRYRYLAVERWKMRSFKDLGIFIYSSLIGMMSHVLWDSFTHKTGTFVRMIPLLKKHICVLNFNLPLYKVLQHGSTLLGFIIIFVYLLSKRSFIKTNVSNYSVTKKIMYWLLIILIGIITFLFRISFTIGGFCIHNIGVYIVSIISGLFIGIILVSIVYKYIYEKECQ